MAMQGAVREAGVVRKRLSRTKRAIKGFSGLACETVTTKQALLAKHSSQARLLGSKPRVSKACLRQRDDDAGAAHETADGCVAQEVGDPAQAQQAHGSVHQPRDEGHLGAAGTGENRLKGTWDSGAPHMAVYISSAMKATRARSGEQRRGRGIQ